MITIGIMIFGGTGVLVACEFLIAHLNPPED